MFKILKAWPLASSWEHRSKFAALLQQFTSPNQWKNFKLDEKLQTNKQTNNQTNKQTNKQTFVSLMEEYQQRSVITSKPGTCIPMC